MGTDIHCAVEVREAGEWTPSKVEGYDVRNYNAFAILANVRNGFGFGGSVTGIGFQPIAPPRGLPEDLSKWFRIRRKSHFGDHSFSHVTLQELESVEWERLTVHEGYVDRDEYVRWREHGKPREWCSGISGGGVFIVGQSEMQRRIVEKDWIPGDELMANQRTLYGHFPWWAGREEGIASGKNVAFYTVVSWSSTYRESAKPLHDYMIEDLSPLGAKYGAENVRLVFGFDS